MYIDILYVFLEIELYYWIVLYMYPYMCLIANEIVRFDRHLYGILDTMLSSRKTIITYLCMVLDLNLFKNNFFFHI